MISAKIDMSKYEIKRKLITPKKYSKDLAEFFEQHLVVHEFHKFKLRKRVGSQGFEFQRLKQ